MYVCNIDLRCIEDHNLGFTWVDRQLLKVTKAGKGVNMSLQALRSKGQQDRVVGKKEHGDQHLM